MVIRRIKRAGTGLGRSVPKVGKYNNRKTPYNGHLYDSKKEAQYASTLDLLVRAKKIKAWERQISLQIVVNGQKICKYICDFGVSHMDGSTEWIDVKGVKTDVYKLKKKLVKACLGIEIIEK